MISDWIEFGQVSAERDAHLSEYFFDNGVLQSVIEDRHQFLVLGRKGAGKTAVFQYLANNPKKFLTNNDLAITLSLQNYSWDVHSLLTAEGKASSLSYIQSWKYIIYLLTIKELISSGRRDAKLLKAKKIIETIYTSPAPTIGQVIGQKLLQLSKLKLPGAGLDLEGGNLDQIHADGGEITFSEVQSNPSIQEALNRSIERLSDIFEDTLLEVLQPGTRVFVTFDRIDEAWDAASFAGSQRVIAGLIGAGEFVTGKFRGSLRPVVFLREDIFDTLDLNDKNKLRSDCGQLLAWTKDGLSRMILERVNFFARSSENEEIARIEDLFDREQMRQQRAPFDYLMLRTMVRPRDFIKYFQLIKEDMKERRHNPFDEDEVNENRLECQSIYNVEPAYSDWLVEELKDEWGTQFPIINDLLSAIQNNGKTNLTSEDFSTALNRIRPQATETEVKAYIRFLFENSIIGFRVGRSQQWRFKCFFKSQGFVASDLYKVHDGLHRGLNLTESRSAG
jgi:hypothetical protein